MLEEIIKNRGYESKRIPGEEFTFTRDGGVYHGKLIEYMIENLEQGDNKPFVFYFKRMWFIGKGYQFSEDFETLEDFKIWFKKLK